MIKVIAKKPRKYLGRRVAKGDHFTISKEVDFDVEWMTHAPNQTKAAQQEIIQLAKSRRDGISNI